MNSSLVKNIRGPYVKYSDCQYLYISSQTLLHAISLFNSSKEGDIERSFSAFHKSWVLLFQADTLNNDEKAHLYPCNCNNEYNCGGKNNCKKNSKKLDYVYGIEKAINALEKHPNSYTLNKLENGYIFDKGNGLFKTLNQKGNFYQNLILMKTLRNIDQHDYLEVTPHAYVYLMDTMRPYVIANIRNYLETYDAIINSRNKCKKSFNSVHCSCNKLSTTDTISKRIFFPWSFNAVFLKNSDDTESLGLIEQYSINANEKLQSLTELQEKLEKDILGKENSIVGIQQGKGNHKNSSKEDKEKGVLSIQTLINSKKEDLKYIKSRIAIIENQIRDIDKSFTFWKNHQKNSDPNYLRREVRLAIEQAHPRSNSKDSLLRLKVGPELNIFLPDQNELNYIQIENLIDTEENFSYSEHQLTIRELQIKMIQTHLEQFEFESLNQIMEALQNDPDILDKTIIPSPYKIKLYKNNLENIPGEIFFAEHFGKIRYTRNFYNFIKGELMNNNDN